MSKDSCANRIKQGLQIREMTQQELCKKTGIKKSAMSQYCRGAFEPKQDKVALIAAALDVDEAWLMGYDVPMERHRANMNTSPSIDKSSLQAAFWGGDKELSQEDMDAMWKDVERFAAFLAEQKKREKGDPNE